MRKSEQTDSDPVLVIQYSVLRNSTTDPTYPKGPVKDENMISIATAKLNVKDSPWASRSVGTM